MSVLFSFRLRCNEILVWLTAVALSLVAGGFAMAQPLEPLSFTSLGTLNLSGGDYTIDTDLLTIVNDTAPGTPLFTGVMDDQGGMAQLNVVPEIAVFAFDSIDLQATANITITGKRAIALVSHGDAMIGSPLSVGSMPRSTTGTGCRAWRGLAGWLGGLLTSPRARPLTYAIAASSSRGLARVAVTLAVPGGPSVFIVQGSASFGGNEHIVSGEILPSTTYGDLLQTLQGGSGGASSSIKDFQVTGNLDVLPAAGVGGGGAIEIGAVGSVQIDADIIARGGAKLVLSNPVDGLLYDTPGSVGGGSGGGIRIHGAQVEVNALLRADYSTSFGTFAGGNGGGGRVVVLNRTDDLPLFVLGIDDVASTSITCP